MNIFFLHKNPKLCARYHLDKHVVKMILETAQMLYSVHWYKELELPLDAYKKAHINHPCSIWSRESLSNYLYLCELGLELCNEYTYRYGKRHKSQDVIEWCVTNKPSIVDIGYTQPPKAMPDEYKVESVVQSYRNYYMGAKSGFAVWKNREKPFWFEEKVLDLYYD